MRWRQRVAATAVAADADGGHGLVATAIEVGRHQPGAGDRVKGIELHKPDRIGRRVGWAGFDDADLDAVGAQVPLVHTIDRRFQIERRVGAVRTHQVVFNDKGQRAVRIAPSGHLAAVAQIALVADDDAGLFAHAAAKTVLGFKGRQCGALVVGINRLVIGSGIGCRVDLQGAIGLLLRVGEQQKTVRASGWYHRTFFTGHDVRIAAAAAAATTAGAEQCCASNDADGSKGVDKTHDHSSSESHQVIGRQLVADIALG